MPTGRVMLSRRCAVLGAVASIAPVPAFAQVGCPPKCKIKRKRGNRCCRRTYELAADTCFPNKWDCSAAAASACRDRC